MQLQPQEQSFLDQVNQALLLAGALAGALSILLGLGLSRGLTAPLARLTAAARRIAGGDLSQRVPETGSAEIATLGQAFNQMAADLEKAEELRRNLLADVAHELRTPLSVLQGNLRAILDGVYPLEQAEIAALYDETRLLSRLVDDLHELAQAEAGQLHLDLRPTDVVEVVQTTLANLAVAAEAKGVRLTTDLAKPMGSLQSWSAPTVWHRSCATFSPTPCAIHQREDRSPSAPPRTTNAVNSTKRLSASS